MALRNQPYIPLYVDDVLSDELVRLCSASACGVYFFLLCILHKQESYGKILLKQKHKQSKSKFSNFALVLSKYMPFGTKQIEESLVELVEEGVIEITDDWLFQKRMVRDGSASLSKADPGKLGGSHSARQYGKSGNLFWMSDYGNKQKIGTSINSQNRLYRIRSDHKLKTFDIIEEISVQDMGISEDVAAEFFKEKIDGEFLNIPYPEMVKKFALLQAKLRAKTQAKEEQIPVNAIVIANGYANGNNNEHSSNTDFALPQAQDEQSEEQEQIDESQIIKKRYANFKKFLLSQNMWCEEVCMKTKSTMDDLPSMIENFISHCIIGGQMHTSEKEFQSHFRNLCLSNIDIVKPSKNAITQEDVDARKENFLQKISLYSTQYDPGFLNAFYLHWSQLDGKTNLMMWEKEKAFEIPNRLSSWKENNKKFAKNGSSKPTDEQLSQVARDRFRG